MTIRTTALEWMKFIQEPLPGIDSYPDELALFVNGVQRHDGEFDILSFVDLHPDEPVQVEGGVIYVDGHGVDLADHFNNWRRSNGIPTTTFVTLEVPDGSMKTLMGILRRHGYAECIVDDFGHADPASAPTPSSAMAP